MRIEHHGKAFDITPDEEERSPSTTSAIEQLAAWVVSLDLGETFALHSQLLSYRSLQTQLLERQEEAQPEIPKWVEKAFSAIDEAGGPDTELDLMAL